MNSRRPYRMQKRAIAAAETGRRILEAMEALFAEMPLSDVTLQAVADRAGVTLQTVIRRFGSKAALVAASAAAATARVAAQRGEAPVGDLPGAVKNLFDHYEEWADTALKMLAEEQRGEEIGELARGGRALHVGWVERVFAPQIEARRGRARAELRHQLVVACDVYVWKLLRRDHGLTRPEAEKVLLGMIRALCGES